MYHTCEIPSVLRSYKIYGTSAANGLKFGIIYVYKATVKALTRPHCVKNGWIILRRIEYFYPR